MPRKVTGKPVKRKKVKKTHTSAAVHGIEKDIKLVENKHYGVCIIDPETMKFVFTNTKLRRIGGYSKQDVPGIKLTDLFYKDDHVRLAMAIKIRSQGNTSNVSNRFRIIRKDGKERIVEAYSNPIDHNGKRYIQSIIKDVTSEVELEKGLQESEQKYRTLVNNIPDGIAIVSKNRFIYVNRKFCQILGCRKDSLIGRMFTSIVAIGRKKDLSGLEKELWESSRSSRNFEIPAIRRDNSHIYLSLRATKILFEEKKCIQVTITDITERKLTENKLIESETQFRNLVENVNYGFYIADLKTHKFLYVNRYGRKLINRLKGGVDDFNSLKLLLPEDKKFVKKIHQDRLEGKLDRLKGELKLVLPSSKAIWVEYESSAVMYKGRLCVQGLFRDITTHKRAERELQKSEERFRQMAESVNDIFWVVEHDPDTTVYVSPAYDNIFGASRKELFKNPGAYLKFVHPDDKWWVEERFDRPVAETSNTYRIIRKDGEVRWLRSRTFPIKNSEGIVYRTVGVVSDVTDRKLAENAIRESEEKYRLLVQNVGAGIAVFDYNGTVLFINRVAAKDLKKEPEEIIGKNQWDLFPKPVADQQMDRIRQVIDSKKQLKTETSLKLSGKNRWYSVIIQPYSDTENKVIAALLILHDITERKIAEEALKESEEKFRMISEQSMLGIIIIQEERVVFANPATAGLLGYSQDEIENWSVEDGLEIIHPDDRDEVYRDTIKRENQDESEGNRSVCRIFREDGKLRWVEHYSKLISYGGKEAILLIVIDVTDRKEAEKQLKNQRDMLREVTGEVIKVQEQERRRISMELHDSTGQSLSLLKLQIHNLLRSGCDDEEKMKNGLRSLSKLVSDAVVDLRQISANLRPVILDNLGLGPTIEWYLKDFSRNTGISIDYDLADKEYAISQQSETHVFRVIQEIMINIQKHSEADKIGFTISRYRKGTEFKIVENGRGFNPDKIFEPSGRTRGMGLINIMERVNILKGKIDISNLDGGGTCFTVFIPNQK